MVILLEKHEGVTGCSFASRFDIRFGNGIKTMQAAAVMELPDER
jgi:hypothetical protein